MAMEIVMEVAMTMRVMTVIEIVAAEGWNGDGDGDGYFASPANDLYVECATGETIYPCAYKAQLT